MCCCADPVPSGLAPSRHIDQHDWEFLRTENVDQRPRPVNDVADGMNEVSDDDALLQVDHDQRGTEIKSGKRHRSNPQQAVSAVRALPEVSPAREQKASARWSW
jgi:hypothetical protein